MMRRRIVFHRRRGHTLLRPLPLLFFLLLLLITVAACIITFPFERTEQRDDMVVDTKVAQNTEIITTGTSLGLLSKGKEIHFQNYCDIKSIEEMHTRLGNAWHLTVPHKKVSGKGVQLMLPKQKSDTETEPLLFLQAISALSDSPTQNLLAGWNCLAAWDLKARCVIAAQSFVVLDRIRKKTEYGVPPYELSSPTEPRGISSLKQNDFTFLVPTLCIRGVPCPVVVVAVPHLRRMETIIATHHIHSEEKGEGKTREWEHEIFSNDMELRYGRGSFWILDAYSNGTTRKGDHEGMRSLLREKARQAMTPMKHKSPYAAHYYWERYTTVHVSSTAEVARPVECRSASIPRIDRQSSLDTTFDVSSCWLHVSSVASLPHIHTADEFVRFFANISSHLNPNKDEEEEKKTTTTTTTKEMNDGIWCAVVVTHLIELRQSLLGSVSELEIPAGCTLLFEADAGIVVGPAVTLRIKGDSSSSSNNRNNKKNVNKNEKEKDDNSAWTRKRSLLIASSVAVGYWAGIIVEPNGILVVEDATIALTGSPHIKRRAGTGSHIRYASPALTGVGGDATHSRAAQLEVHHSAFLNCAGPGFGVGQGVRLNITDTLFQDVAQGGECVGCEANLERVHILDVPFESHALQREIGGKRVYVDGDNDGLYLRDGEVTLRQVVVANTLDDCIDSASSAPKMRTETDTPEVTHLFVNGSILQNCLHEGVALSSSVGTRREVVMENSIISDAQQGVENGHTAPDHMTRIRRLLFRRNLVALRHGDNYPLPVKGVIRVDDSLFVDNAIHVLDEEFVRHAAVSVETKKWFNPWLDISKEEWGQHITITNSSGWRTRGERHDASPKLKWWRVYGNRSLEAVMVPEGELNPILCGRRHYRNT